MDKPPIIAIVNGYECRYTDEPLLLWERVQVSDTCVHVHPLSDIFDHTPTESCRCKPKVGQIGANTLVVHNSFDGRESWEKFEVLKSSRLNH